MNKFQRWVKDTYGRPAKLARDLAVTDAAVRVWIEGKGAPRGEMVLKIVELSRGKLSSDDVLKCTLENVERKD